MTDTESPNDGMPGEITPTMTYARAVQIMVQANCGGKGEIRVWDDGKVFLDRESVVRTIRHAVAWADLNVWSARMREACRPELLTRLASGDADKFEQLEAALIIRKLLTESDRYDYDRNINS